MKGGRLEGRLEFSRKFIRFGLLFFFGYFGDIFDFVIALLYCLFVKSTAHNVRYGQIIWTRLFQFLP